MRERYRARGNTVVSQMLLRLESWLTRHVQVFFYTLGQLSRAYLNTILTASVIGIALAFPTGLYVLVENAQTVGKGWDGSAQVSVFLNTGVDDDQVARVTERLRDLPDVATFHVVSRQKALEEYQELSGFKEVLVALDTNPLPTLIVVEPRIDRSDPDQVRDLAKVVEQWEEVDLAQYDLQWVQRFHAIMEIVQRGIVVLAAVLCLAVLLVVGNTIRMGIQGRREEIEIAKLFGATNAFIRRPFLYVGLWYGLMGGVLAWMLVGLSFAMLRQPVRRLADLYYSDFLLQGLDFSDVLALLAVGALLGLGGSWVAVARQLSSIEPS
jgi:cell division transport system permease protein